MLSTKRCRSSSLERRLIFQPNDFAPWTESLSRGPNIMRVGHHQHRARPEPSPSAPAHPCIACAKGRSPGAGGSSPLCNANHCTRIRAVRTAAQGDLVRDRSAIDQPADCADVGPRGCRIVEDARVLVRALVQPIEQVVAARPERLGGAVQVQPVTRLVLDLGDEDRLAPQRWCPR